MCEKTKLLLQSSCSCTHAAGCDVMLLKLATGMHTVVLKVILISS
jgi:hypothetical protein